MSIQDSIRTTRQRFLPDRCFKNDKDYFLGSGLMTDTLHALKNVCAASDASPVVKETPREQNDNLNPFLSKFARQNFSNVMSTHWIRRLENQNGKYSEWLIHFRDTLDAVFALPWWSSKGGGEGGAVAGWNIASSGPVPLQVLWKTMNTEKYPIGSLPLFHDINYLMSWGFGAESSQLPSETSTRTLFPVYLEGDEPAGRLMALSLDAVRYSDLGQPLGDQASRPVFFPHPDCCLLPISDDFLECFLTAWKFWSNPEGEAAKFPDDVAFRYKIVPLQQGTFRQPSLNGPSAGLAIALALGKVIAHLPENLTRGA